MDNRWIEKIFEGMIDGARELDSAPLDRDIKEAINRFVDNKYQPKCRKKSLDSFSKILFKVLNNIELGSDIYAYDRRKKVDPFESGILYRGLKTAEEYQSEHLQRKLDRAREKTKTDSLLTVSDIASRYDCTAQTVTGWIRDEKLKATKIGKSYRIKQSDWEEFTKSK